MPSEVSKYEAKSWLLYHKEDTLGSLDRNQSLKLVGALLKSGAILVEVEEPLVDTLWITIPVDSVARVMVRLANYHPDETEHLSCSDPGQHVIRAWWD